MTDPVAYRKLYRRRRRAVLLEYIGGVDPACSRCGSVERLEFDHVDPSTKSFNINDRLWEGVASLKDELDKCQLLCEACHLTKTRVERSKYFHGKPYAFEDRGCDCYECLAAKQAWLEQPEVARKRKPIQLFLVRS